MSHNNHPAHPVRNFFYTLYSLLNALAFVAFFYALYNAELPSRGIVLGASGALLACALFFGILRPAFRKGR